MKASKLSCHERHDGSGTKGDVFRCAKHTVDDAAHEGRVQAVLQNKHTVDDAVHED